LSIKKGVGLHSSSGRLRVVPPFDWSQSLRFLRGFGPLSGEQEVTEGALTKALTLDGQTFVFRVAPDDGGGGGTGLRYELFSDEPISREREKVVAERVSFFLSLDDDLSQFYSIARKDRKFYPLVERSWGLHHVKFPTLLEICCWAIITQRVQRAIALRTKKSLVDRYGKSIELDGTKYRAFPDISALEGARPSELYAVTRNQRTAARLDALVRTFGDLDEHFLRTALYQKAEAKLRTIPGIGEWSAQFVLFRGLGRIERLRYGQERMVERMKEVYGPESRTLDEINDRYGPWCGYWSLYVWASTM
jgi:DNA-3-methyladenine glycosylase II